MDDNDHALKQVLVDASIFIDLALQRIRGIGGLLEDINGLLDYFLDHLDYLESACVHWPRLSIQYIMEDIEEMGVLVEKISAMVALQAAMEKISELKPMFDK